MTDGLDRIIERVESAARHRGRAAYIVVAVMAALLLWWLIRFDVGRHEVGDKIAEIRTAAATSERRAEAIVDATRQREVTARAQAKKKVAALPPDELCAALDRLLAEYRADDQ